MKIYNLHLFSTFFQRHSIVVHKSYIAGHADSSFPVHILYIELGEQVTFENEALRKTHVNLPGINSSKKIQALLSTTRYDKCDRQPPGAVTHIIHTRLSFC